MGEPDNPNDFIQLDVDDLTVYVSKDIWDALKPGQSKWLVAVPGYGRFWLYVEPTPSVPRQLE